jgi:hypothetical protein
MYDNSNLEVRCRALWAEVLCAVESRVYSINDYVRNSEARLGCQMLSGETVEIVHPRVNRTLHASLDLKDHAIDIKEFDGDMLTAGTRLPFALLGDGNIYVTAGKSLMGDPMAVARQLMSVLLSKSEEPSSSSEVEQYRSWASALMTARARRVPINLDIEIQTETALHPASTLDLSPVGVKVQSSAALDRGNYVTIFRGTLGSFFRVVWAEPTDQGTRAGLVCLNPPLEWAELSLQ